MKVLGLNGWPGRGHDGAACVVSDGRIAAFAEEERFVRRKHAYGLAPLHAAAFVLAREKITLDDIDVVAFGWDVPTLHRDRDVRWTFSPAEALESLLPSTLFPRRRDPELVFVPHHLSHAASAYHASGDADAALLVIDGQGENESTSLGLARSGKITLLETLPISWSLGYFYDAVGRYIGLGPDQAGKLMGLAAYGTVREGVLNTFRLDDSGYHVDHISPGLRSTENIDESKESTEAWLSYLESTWPQPPNRQRRVYDPETARFLSLTERDPFDYRDLAATAQFLLEQAVSKLVDRLFAITDSRTLHVAGGVGFNATLNGVLIKRHDLDRLFVQPLAGDAGVALGAALHVAAEHGDVIRPMTDSLGWGPEFSAQTIRRLLDDAGVRYAEPPDVTGAAAEFIANDEVIGWFQGAGEVGPRALGHRSILACPADVATRDRINLRIKQREWWRPLAPSISLEHHAEIIDSPSALPYMIVTTPLRPEKTELLLAVNHVDGTTRAQTVNSADEPLYHRLLLDVERETGLAAVLNTSFNGPQEPIVWTPADAMRTFTRLGLDALVLGPFVIRKRT
ncbi:carbamoyltransferase C-terminal domain-containing protein [Streptosporangium sp. NPDC006930]|uniref:carbamoyltransferase family protein n=1 Tax=unclassified Streptosporangium TaxID=2632669 RepID=UPI00342FAA83